MERPRRREVLAGLAGVGSLAASSVLATDGFLAKSSSLTTTVPDGTWQEYGHGPRRSGYAPSADGPTTDPTEQWQVDIEWSDVTLPEVTSPVVDERHVYVLESDALVALDRNDGRERWRFRPPQIAPPPAVRKHRSRFDDEPIAVENASFSNWMGWLACRDGQVFVNGGTPKFSVLYAVDAASGSLNWAVPGVNGQALLGDGVLFNDGPSGYPSGIVDASSGRLLETGVRVGYSDAVFTGPDVRSFDDRNQSYHGSISTIRLADGDDIVRKNTYIHAAAITSTGLTLAEPNTREIEEPVVVDLRNERQQRLAVDFEFHAQFLATDDENWYVCTENGVIAIPVVEPTGESTGTPLWKKSIPPAVNKPVVTETALYVPTDEGIFILDPQTGDELYRIDTPIGTVRGNNWHIPPVAAAGTLYCLLDGTLYAYT